MMYKRGNVVIGVYKDDRFGKNPWLWIGTINPNTVLKVASFGSEDKANTFIKWFEYITGLTDKEPLKEDEKHGR